MCHGPSARHGDALQSTVSCQDCSAQGCATLPGPGAVSVGGSGAAERREGRQAGHPGRGSVGAVLRWHWGPVCPPGPLRGQPISGTAASIARRGFYDIFMSAFSSAVFALCPIFSSLSWTLGGEKNHFYIICFSYFLFSTCGSRFAGPLLCESPFTEADLPVSDWQEVPGAGYETFETCELANQQVPVCSSGYAPSISS